MKTRSPKMIVIVRNSKGRIVLYSGYSHSYVDATCCVNILKDRAPADCNVIIEIDHEALRKELDALGAFAMQPVIQVDIYPGKSPVINVTKQKPLEGGAS